MKKILDANWEKGKYVDIRRFKKAMPKKVFGFVLVGARGDGKSTSGRKWLENWVIKNPDRKFLYLTRLDEEVKLKRKKVPRMFEKIDCVVEGYEIYRIEKEIYTNKNGVNKTRIVSKIFVGEIQALNNSSKMRSGEDYHKEGFDVIFWDEFCEEQGKSLPDEFGKFKSVIETVFRTRKDDNIMVLCVSNEVDPYNSVFRGLECPDDLKTGQVYIDTDQRFAYYRTRTSTELKKEKKDSFSYNFGKKSEYNAFAFENNWKIDNADNIVPHTYGIMKEKFNIVWLNQYLGVWEHNRKWRISNQLTNGKTYPLSNTDAVNKGLPFQGNGWFYSLVNGANARNNIEFESPDIKEAMAAFVARNR